MADITRIATVTSRKLAVIGHMLTLHGLPASPQVENMSDDLIEETHQHLHELIKDHMVDKGATNG